MKSVFVILVCIWQGSLALGGFSLPTVRIGSSGGAGFMALKSQGSQGSSSLSFGSSMPRIRFNGMKPSIVMGAPNYIPRGSSPIAAASNSFPSAMMPPFPPMRPFGGRPFYPMMPFHPMGFGGRPFRPVMPNYGGFGGYPFGGMAAASMRSMVRVPFHHMPVIPMARRQRRFRGYAPGFGGLAAGSGLYGSFSSPFRSPFSSGFSMDDDKFTAEENNDFTSMDINYKPEEESSYQSEGDMMSEYKPPISSGEETDAYKSQEEYNPQEEHKTPGSKQISMKKHKATKMKYQPTSAANPALTKDDSQYKGKAQTYSPAYYGASPVTDGPKYEEPKYEEPKYEEPKCPPCPTEKPASYRDDSYEEESYDNKPRKSKKMTTYDEEEDDSSSRRRRRPSPTSYDDDESKYEDDCEDKKVKKTSKKKTSKCSCSDGYARSSPSIRRRHGTKSRGKRSAEIGQSAKLILVANKRNLQVPTPKASLTLDDKGEIVGSITKALTEALARNHEIYEQIGVSRQARKVDDLVKVVENPQYHPHRPVIHHHHYPSPAHSRRLPLSPALPHHPLHSLAKKDPFVSLLLLP